MAFNRQLAVVLRAYFEGKRTEFTIGRSHDFGGAGGALKIQGQVLVDRFLLRLGVIDLQAPMVDRNVIERLRLAGHGLDHAGG